MAGVAVAVGVGVGVGVGCASTPVAAPPGLRVLVLPPVVRAGPTTLSAGSAQALDEAARRAGAAPVRPAPCLAGIAAPCNLAGDEPDATLAAAALGHGTDRVLSGWLGELPDGRVAWGLRLVDAAAGATADRAAGVANRETALPRLAEGASRLLRPPEEVSLPGQRSAADLAHRLSERAGLLEHCVVERLLATPELAGAARLAVTVDVRGAVQDVQVRASTFEPALDACLADAAAHVDFPPGVGGTTVVERTVAWPPPGP